MVLLLACDQILSIPDGTLGDNDVSHGKKMPTVCTDGRMRVDVWLTVFKRDSRCTLLRRREVTGGSATPIYFTTCNTRYFHLYRKWFYNFNRLFFST